MAEQANPLILPLRFNSLEHMQHSARQSVWSEAQKIALLFGCILLLILREPRFLGSPRFWAEEGSRYFAYAYTHGWYDALAHADLGYIALWPNLATTIAANLVPLEHAPLVTTLFAAVVQVIPIMVIVWSNGAFWNGFVTKVVGCFAVVFAPLSHEIWFNTVNSQFYFLLITLLVSIEDANAKRARRIMRRVLLVVAGLTGAVSLFLLPVFVVKAAQEKHRERVVQAVLLAACAVVQGAVFWSSHAGADASRQVVADVPLFAAVVWVQSIVMSTLGWERAASTSRLIISVRDASRGTFVGMGIALLLAEAMMLWAVARRPWVKERWVLVLGYVCILVGCYAFSLGIDIAYLLGAGNGQRYFYVANVTFWLLLLQNIRIDTRDTARAWSIVCVVVLTIALVGGVQNYRRMGTEQRDWPRWQAEVAQWRNDSTYCPHIAPAPWRMCLGAARNRIEYLDTRWKADTPASVP